MCFLFLRLLCDQFCELCPSSRTNKHSSFLYPKYSHTTNFDLDFDVGSRLEIMASVSDVVSAARVGGAREQLSGKLLPRHR